MISTMTTTIDADGKIVIPEELLEQAGIKPGMQVTITYYNGRIEIEPAGPGMHIEMRGRVAVLVPNEPVEQSNIDVVKLIDELREERINEILGYPPAGENDRRG
jgi:AbrB family looped-hinge helix DNA binding protein